MSPQPDSILYPTTTVCSWTQPPPPPTHGKGQARGDPLDEFGRGDEGEHGLLVLPVYLVVVHHVPVFCPAVEAVRVEALELGHVRAARGTRQPRVGPDLAIAASSSM